MNAHQYVKRPQPQLLAGFVAIAAVGVVLANPPSASAHREVLAAGSCVPAVDSVDYIAVRKAAWAQDRVDRPWLYR